MKMHAETNDLHVPAGGIQYVATTWSVYSTLCAAKFTVEK